MVVFASRVCHVHQFGIHSPPAVPGEWMCPFCRGTMIGAFSRALSTTEGVAKLCPFHPGVSLNDCHAVWNGHVYVASSPDASILDTYYLSTCCFSEGGLSVEGLWLEAPSTTEACCVQLICVHFILTFPWTIVMLNGMVMFASQVHHMHQFGYIFHLLFFVSERPLSVEGLWLEHLVALRQP